MEKYITRPTTSTSMATKGAEALAGKPGHGKKVLNGYRCLVADCRYFLGPKDTPYPGADPIGGRLP